MLEDRHPLPQRSRVPDLLVEQLLLGELSPDRAARVRAELESQPDGLDRVASLRRSNEELLLVYPARSVVPAIERRAGLSRRRSALFLLIPALATGATMLALAVHSGRTKVIGPRPAPEVIIEKGSPHLRVYRKELNGAPRLEPGAIVHAHDLLQVSYLSDGMKYGVIFSIDGRGGVTLHYPDEQGDPQILHGQKEIMLPHSYELDDAPSFERFFFVTSNAPIDIDAVLNQARDLASHPDQSVRRKLDLPDGVSQYSITLRKGTR